MPVTPRRSNLRRRIKRSLSRKFRYYPLLKLLVLKPWFRTVFLAAVGFGVFVALFLPKIWRTSPDGFTPVIVVSGLDMSQAWSLKRTARKAAASGDFENAGHSWQMAVAQNPADFEGLRGYLDNFVKISRPQQSSAKMAINQMGWLLRLGRTNAADLDRVAAVCDRFNWHEIAAYFLGGAQDRLPKKAEIAYIKALFHEGRFDRFKERLDKLGGGAGSEALALYAQAYAMGWGGEGDAAAATRSLVAAMERPDEGTTAARLLLIVSAKKGDLDGYETALNKLALSNYATVLDHVNHWTLLAAKGRLAEASKLAEAFTSAPQNANEMVRLADVYLKLGLKESGREVLQRFVPEFGNALEGWKFYAAFLQDQKDWGELRNLALKIREQPFLSADLRGYSYFLEGLADYRLNLADASVASFSKAADGEFESVGLAAAIAKEMTQMNGGAPALRVLGGIEKDFLDDEEFWEAFFAAAYNARDEAAVLKSAEQSYRLKPRDVQIHNRYAAALMLNKKDPEESIKMTLQLMNLYPQSVAAIINHSYALMLNRREKEAMGLLETLSGRELGAREANAFHLGLFEVYYSLEMWDKAMVHADKVNPGSLFPSQRESFEQKRKALPDILASKTKSPSES